LETFKARGWLKARQRQRTDATHVVAAIRTLTRIEMVGETLRQALNHLATVVPAWLRDHIPAEWYDRYGKAFDEYRMPKTETALLELAEQIGRDGQQLLVQVEGETTLSWLKQLPALAILREVWQQQ
jgi:transposase